MATEIVMPRLGWTMEEGTLLEWLKKDGDAINVGDLIFTVESDKAVNEVEAFENGILRIPPSSPALGTLMPVGTLLAYVVQPGEALPFEGSSGQTATVNAVSVSADTNGSDVMQLTSPPSPLSIHGEGENRFQLNHSSVSMPAISPRARRVAHELGVEWTTVKGSGRTGRIVERDIRAAAEHKPAAQVTQPSVQAVDISPVARRAADELGVDLGQLAAQMPGKRITREDVERAAQTKPVVIPAVNAPSTGDKRMPISRVRQVISERMSSSAQTTAPVTLTTEVDATELVNLRKGLKLAAESDKRPVPTYNDLLAKLVSGALTEHPMLNARFENDEIVVSSAVHMGFAVDTERGLLVPVVQNVQDKTIRQIAAEAAPLAEQARNGTLSADHMRGGTFTITNLGMYEIDAFTPIINLPECAILGVGRIVAKQVVVDAEAGQVAIRQMMFLSLTFDHRLVDGAPAARFLQRIKQFIEQPYLWLVG